MLCMVNGPRIAGLSSYYDCATAEYALSQALDVDQLAMSARLQGETGHLKIELHSFPCWYIGVSRGASQAVDVSSTRAILVRDASIPTAYKISIGLSTTS